MISRSAQRGKGDALRRALSGDAGPAQLGRAERVGRFAVSTGHPGVTHYLLTRLLVPHGPRARLRRALLPWLPPSMREAWLFDGRSGGEHGDAVPRELWDRAVEFARAAGLAWAREAGWILLGDPPTRDRLRLTMFLFPPSQASPGAVLKLRAGHAAGATLAAEWQALVKVAELDERLRQSVPAPIAYQFGVDGELMIESALDGTSAYVALKSAPPRRRALEALFASAAAWLAAFHGPVRDDQRRMTAFGHGDYWAHNILLNAASGWPGVVDWEHFSADAPRFLDLYHFPLSYVLLQPWIRVGACSPVHAFRLGLLDENPVSGAVRDFLERYCRETGLEPESLRGLLHEYLQTNGLPVPGRAHGDTAATHGLATQCRELLEAHAGPAFLPRCVHSS